ncbi:hypothetical protein Tco_0688114 [Tanacetum coccineum]
MKESDAYKTYYDFATGKVIPKPKYVRRSTREKIDQAPKDSPGKRLKATAKVAKSGKKKLHAQGLETLSAIALSEADQMKLITKRSKTDYHILHASGSCANEGTGVKPRVPDVPTYGSEDDQISWKFSEEDDDDEVSMSKDDDDNADGEDDDDQDDDNEQTELDNDAYDEVNQGGNVEKEKMDEEKTNEEDKTNEFYSDVNINLERRDTKMTDAPHSNVQATQVIEYTYVIITDVTPEVQQQSSSVSSGFISKMLNPIPDTGIDSILNLNIESTSLVDVPVTTHDEIPPSFVTTLPPPPIPLIQPLQQTPVSTTTIVPSTSLQNLPNFSSLFKFEDRVKSIKDDFLEFKQTNPFAEAVSLIPGIVDKYLANQMNEALRHPKEGDYKRLFLQDIEDMLLLLVQGKLKNLTIEERLALSVSVRMFTRSIVIKRRVEDLQLGIESYQKKLNLTKPDTDGTLNDVRSALDDILKRIWMEYVPQTVWRSVDRERAGAMIQAIDQQLRNRRIMKSLKKFVGRRPYMGDLRLLERTI